MTSPLSGLKVVDLSVARAGPTTVRQLAEFGAEVVRIEMPDDGASIVRDHTSSDYLNLHANKRLINLDLKTEQGREVLLRLLADADVLVENFRPAVKSRLRVSFPELQPLFPKLIYASISGFGQDGPRADQGAVDQIMQGFAGLMSLTGDEASGPFRAGVAISDLAAGMLLSNAVLMALLERNRSGHGQWVQVSLLEAVLSVLDFQAARWTVDGENPGPVGNQHPTSSPMGMFETADGFINLAAPSDRLYQRLCGAVGAGPLLSPAYASARERHANREALNNDLNSVLRTRGRDEWIAIFDAVGVPCGPVNTVAEAFDDPQVRHLGMCEQVDHPVRGRVSILRSPITMSASPRVPKQSSPMPGQDTDSVLAELGYVEAEIAELRERGVV
jgi:crotonobetainyl-CoA:carnitine CoA-transferase CaiB-like acyl-CoA transferase